MSDDSFKYEKERELLNRKLLLLGTNVGEIPCFRNSFLYGITSGIVAGIASFAFTSKIKRSTSIGFWSYIGITSVYWIHCRYKFALLKFEYEQLTYAMQQQVMFDGTSLSEDTIKQLKQHEEQKTSSTSNK